MRVRFDPTTGNLAVTNEYSRNSSPGSVAIYKNARGKPQLYRDSNFYYMFFCGYDNAGNLFVNGQPAPSGGFAFAELPARAGETERCQPQCEYRFPGRRSVGRKLLLAVGDQISSTIYRFAIAGKVGTEVGSTQLGGTKQIVQFWKQGAYVVGPDAIYFRVGIWKYPAGGNPVKFLSHSWGLPVAATVSKPASH